MALIGLSLSLPAIAQPSIVPADGTQVEQNAADYSITGGQPSADGLNLFHGFDRFNLDQSEQATFVVPAGVAHVLGRISGGEASLINGQLQLVGSNADLFLLNPAGIIFGKEATLALPGDFLATTADSVLFDGGTFPALGSVDYASLVGQPTGLDFWVNAGGALVNSGNLEVAPGATLALVGSRVVNEGNLLSPGGSVTLAAVPEGHYVRLSAVGSVLAYDVAPQQLTSEIEPLDLPTLLTEPSVASATGLVVNPDGSLQLAGANIDAATGTTLSSGEVVGEAVQFLGEQVGLLDGQVVASGGGNIWVGGNQEGTGPLPNARAVYVAPTATVTADATGQGTGGNIIVWSEESSRIYGTVSARGGDQGGDGGFVETSSRGFLEVTQRPDVSAAFGNPGLWLLDPFDIEIRDNGGNNENLSAASPFTATGSVSVLDVDLLSEALSNGSVVVSTGSGGTESGNITLIDPLNYTASPGATLELLAAGNIVIEGAIAPAATATPLNLQLLADTDRQGNGVVTINGAINTAGGNLTVDGNGEQLTSAAGVSLLAGSNIQTNGGDVTLTGRHSNSPGVLVEDGVRIDTGGTGQISINGVSNTGIGVDLGDNLVTDSSLLTLDGRINNPTELAIQSAAPLVDNDVRLNAVGDIEVNYIETQAGIDITTTNFLRVTGSNAAGQSLLAPNSIRIRHGGNGQTPFVVGNASTNGTVGAIATDTSLTPVQSFSGSFSQGSISILTMGSNLTDCVDGCNDDLSDEDFSDGDLDEDNTLDDFFDDDVLDFEDSDEGTETDGELASDSSFEDGDSAEDADGEDDNGGDNEFGDDEFDDEEEEEFDDEDEEFEEDEEFGDEDVFFEILDDAEITSEELAAREQSISQEYSQYLGVRAERNLPLPEVQQKLSQVTVETGYVPGILYINFVPDTRPQAKQVLEISPENNLLELVLVTADKPPHRLLVDSTQADIQTAVAQLHRGVISQSLGRRYLRPAKRLHSSLIEPLEDILSKQGINHLAFVLPSGLRALPLAALHNGDSFLIERYSLGIMPSVGLTNIDYSDVRSAEVLAVGASTFPDQPDLPAVPLELKTIADTLWPGQFFLNESFTPEQVLANRQRGDYSILHLATHGEFRAGDPSNSYIQFWDQRVTLSQLPNLSLNDPPVDLLVLSACRTALGSREAELGFAGLAVQAGVKTAMASLWRVDDVGTAGLMTEFYAHLRDSTLRAEALRQAQLAMIRGDITVDAGELTWTGGRLTMPPALANETRLVLNHPFYWAAFTLIGSPW
ncbi:CHAT domain-containing protein [Leptolyngbya cf. ectocarpi LEGE 11479]|uniref:CHAT domain-containing protein n=1 Tax=Leptolyngbya cf. ectocarpi LEGE 11479 TaxID=1828722 RepID=A0A929F967_LEPEC|nr:CHAT domain-containing protein [Leptolyngbya cf. ectocarpi LEGE 11479]